MGCNASKQTDIEDAGKKSSSQRDAKRSCHYRIYVKTGDRKGAGTDANVTFILHNDEGQSTRELHMDRFLKNDFERNKKDDFTVEAECLNKVDMIELWRDDSGIADEWFVEFVEVCCDSSGKRFVFPILRWIKEKYHYKIRHLDTSLPQHDPNKEQRNMELKHKKETYQMEVKIPELFVQSKQLPDDEKFSFNYQFDFVTRVLKLKVGSKLTEWGTGYWEKIEDLHNVYSEKFFPKPAPLAKGYWDTDEYFGNQRTAGLNHSLIRLCTEIPQRLAVTDEMLKPFLEGSTLGECITQKRLFYTDHEIMEGIQVTNKCTVCAPIALFYLNSKRNLVPIAIQLQQKPAEDNPVFLPSDPPYTWLAAKLWYNNADSNYQQSVTHLGFTHLLMEGCVLVTHRNLSISHPVFKLLAPHFLYLAAINALALDTLISDGGFLDVNLSVGNKGAFQLMKKHFAEWKMNEHGTLPVDLEKRGLLDQNVLPGYHYRNDALPLYNIIKTYVTKYLRLYYDCSATFEADTEIQVWAEELVKPRNEGGCGIQGVPGEGSIRNEDDLVTILTSIVFTCSVAHAATNFAQYEEYGFPPNNPLIMKGTPPKDKTPLTESCILDALPNKEGTLEAMAVTSVLSDMGTNKLGDFEVKYIYDPKAEKVVGEFCKELAVLSKKMETSNKTRKFEYKWLNPKYVPNSISI